MPTTVQQQQTRDLNRAYDGGFIDKKEFLSEVVKVSGKTAEEVEAALYGDHQAKNTQLLEFIEQVLKPKYKIGLLSNISSNWIREELLTEKEQKLFDDFVFSYEVRMTKPDPRIFELACARLGVELGEAVLIDDIDRYCSIAQELGMKTVLYKDFNDAKQELEKLLADPNN